MQQVRPGNQQEVILRARKVLGARFAWFALCGLVLAWWYSRYGLDTSLSERLRAESLVYLILWLNVLTFPVGVALTYVLGLMYYSAEQWGVIPPGASSPEVVAIWTGFAVAGYLQWFKLAPLILRWLTRRRLRAEEQ
jgi:hypothetical protein